MTIFNEITLIDYKRPLQARKEARKVVGPYRWTPTAPGNGRGFYMATDLTMAPHGAGIDLRLEDANDHLSGRYPTAYWTSEDGTGDKIKPIIARLPRGRGFLAGWTMGRGMCASLDGSIYPNEEDAARAAHSEAESASEDAIEHDQEFQANLKAEEEATAAGWTYQTARMTGNPTFYHPDHGHVMAEGWSDLWEQYADAEAEGESE